jgi:hypothetical protein
MGMSSLTKGLVLVFAILVIAQMNLVKADPYVLNGFVPPDSLTKPPNVQVNNPQNGSVITSNNVSLSFHVTKPVSPKASQTVITYVYYEADWLKDTTFLYNYETPEIINGNIIDPGYIEKYDYSYNFSKVPDGNHSIIIHADGMGWYPPSDGLHYNGFKINGSTTLQFNVDSNPPKVAVSIQNLSSTDQFLNISLNKNVSAILYSLDGQNNVTANGNVTFSGLANGKHNVTVYVEDQFGLTDKADAAFFVFTKEQNPVNNAYWIPIIILLSIIVISLLLYRRYRKTASNPKA